MRWMVFAAAVTIYVLCLALIGFTVWIAAVATGPGLTPWAETSWRYKAGFLAFMALPAGGLAWGGWQIIVAPFLDGRL